MAKIPITTKSEYDMERENNEAVFKDMLKRMRPDIFVLMDLLDTTGVSYYILFKILRHLKAISEGTQHGKIEIDIVAGVVTYIRGIEQDKLLEPIIKRNEML